MGQISEMRIIHPKIAAISGYELNVSEHSLLVIFVHFGKAGEAKPRESPFPKLWKTLFHSPTGIRKCK